MLTANELHSRGLEASNSGRHSAARALYRRALKVHPNSEERARVLLSLAHVEAELGSVSDGLALCDEALAIVGNSGVVAGLAHSQRALLLMRSGHGGRALNEFAAALALLDDDPTPLARLYLNRGMVHLQRSEADPAKTDFRQAAAWSKQAGLEIPLAKATFNLGYAHLLEGDLATALRLMDEAKPQLDPLSPVTRAINEQDRAEVLLAAGMPQNAAEALRRAAKAFGSRRLRQRQAEAEFVLASLLLTSDPREASRVASRARRRFELRGSSTWAARAEGVEIIANLRRTSSPATLVARADLVVDILRGAGIVVDASRLSLHTIQCLARAGEIADARQRLRHRRVRNSSPLPERLLEREIRADIATRCGRRSDAIEHLRRGLTELHEWQSSFGSLDLQSTLVGHGRGLALRGMSIALSDGRPDVVFEWAERARALAGRVAPVRPPADPHAAEQLSELRRVQRAIALGEARGGAPTVLRRRADELRTFIRQRAWHDQGSGMVTEPETLDSVQARLAPDETVVSIIAVDKRLHALVVTARSTSLVDLGPLSEVRSLLAGMQADLDMAAAHLPEQVRQAVHGGLGQRLVRLSSLLVAPWSSHVRDRRVVVVPSGALAGTPWTLLPDLAGLPLTVPRSASEWVHARDHHDALHSAGFVAGPHVSRAEEEVKRSSHAWGATSILVGDDVVAERIRWLASDVDVLHVAAHGRHSADNPLFSGLELIDGPWFGYDIDQLTSIPTTVILSACELGRSTVRWGEETIGMTVAWLHAGARCVIASPALVDDDVACEVLARTHQGLATGDAPADALAAAMAEVERGVAPFICFGSGW